MDKVLGTLLTKLVSDNKIDWDEHLSTILFSYITIYKVEHVQSWMNQLVYGLHPLMPPKYIVQIANGNERDNIPVYREQSVAGI